MLVSVLHQNKKPLNSGGNMQFEEMVLLGKTIIFEVLSMDHKEGLIVSIDDKNLCNFLFAIVLVLKKLKDYKDYTF